MPGSEVRAWERARAGVQASRPAAGLVEVRAEFGWNHQKWSHHLLSRPKWSRQKSSRQKKNH